MTAVRHRLVVCRDAASLAATAADHVTVRAAQAVEKNGWFHFAVSGGATPWAMFEQLSQRDMPWRSTSIYQVDERIAPIEDPDRNLVHLTEALAGAPATVVAMEVDDLAPDLAARDYEARLPESFDLVHLGLGSDGHTASLVPGDDVLAVTDRLVAPTASTYGGNRRLTLTYAALARAAELLWLVSGADKAHALQQLLAGDDSIPASRVTAGASVVMADAPAAGDLPDDGDEEVRP